MGGHPEEREEDTPMEAFLQLVHLRMAIPQRVELARGGAQVGIQTLLQALIKDHLAQGKAGKWEGGNVTPSQPVLLSRSVKFKAI